MLAYTYTLSISNSNNVIYIRLHRLGQPELGTLHITPDVSYVSQPDQGRIQIR